MFRAFNYKCSYLIFKSVLVLCVFAFLTAFKRLFYLFKCSIIYSASTILCLLSGDNRPEICSIGWGLTPIADFRSLGCEKGYCTDCTLPFKWWSESSLVELLLEVTTRVVRCLAAYFDSLFLGIPLLSWGIALAVFLVTIASGWVSSLITWMSLGL